MVVGALPRDELKSAVDNGLAWVRRSSAEAHAGDTKRATLGIPGKICRELHDSKSTPGQRYRALVYYSLKPENRLAWTPWTQIISEKKHMELLEKKGRRPRSSMELLTQMCWEDVPQIDEASLSAGPWRIIQILQIRSNAFALCGECHLASHKTFDAKLLACYTQQYATDSGLRSPNLTMSADRHLMEKIYQLVNEENWNLDDALHKYSTVRLDMVAVLQPRPRPSSAAAPMKGGKGQRERTPPPQRRESKGKSDRKGDKKGEGEGKSEGKNRLMEY